MKIYKLAHNTVDDKDYKVLINFLKNRKYLNQSKVTRAFEQKFSIFLGSKTSTFVHRYGLYLPNHANINKLDIDYISKCFKFIAEPIFFNIT